MSETGDAPPNKRRGCLAFGCLVPIVLVVVVGVGGFFAARSFVRSHLDEWRADAPLVDIAITLLGLRDGSDPDPGVVEAVRGDQDPAHLPDGIVVVAGAEPVVNVTPDVVVVFQETSRSSAETAGGLREALIESGWRLVDEGEVPGGRETVWSDPTYTCRYEVVDGTAAPTEVWIRCVTVAAAS